MMLKKDARAIIGGLSRPGKIPGFGIGFPIEYCRTGSKLRLIPGTVCYECYAGKGNYRFKNVRNALERRYQILKRVLSSGVQSHLKSQYIEAFTTLLNSESYFRFHDSGDLQSVNHLLLCCHIAESSPNCNFWLPSKELRIIKAVPPLDVPRNLTIRYSSKYIGTLTSAFPVNSATFYEPENASRGFVCPAPLQGNKCLKCRACWDSEIQTVIYKKH